MVSYVLSLVYDNGVCLPSSVDFLGVCIFPKYGGCDLFFSSRPFHFQRRYVAFRRNAKRTGKRQRHASHTTYYSLQVPASSSGGFLAGHQRQRDHGGRGNDFRWLHGLRPVHGLFRR